MRLIVALLSLAALAIASFGVAVARSFVQLFEPLRMTPGHWSIVPAQPRSILDTRRMGLA